MTDYAGTFERYFREYSDNGLDRRRTISYQLRAWRYYRCRKTISPQGRWYANLYLDLYGICRRHVDIYLDTTNLSEFLEWRSGAYRRPSPYRYWFLGSRSYYSKSWKRAWTHYGGLYLGNGCSRFGRWCRYVLGRFYHYGIYLVRIGFFRKAGATYVFGWC